ncbi:MAG: 3-oxoacyl-ACP synthase III [Arenimonas sp.]|nr:3-oxoacyl-ACP synthase III [Arenimonas sp.]
MLFEHVAIAGLAHIDAPHALSSAEINAQLKPTMDRLGIRTDVLGDIAGIHSRRMWDKDTLASDAATLAGEKALLDAGISRDRIGLLVNTSVSRDYLEPSTASIVAGNLGLGENCQNFDVANACLAFLNGMDIASRMIERGEIEYALVVDGETANLVYDNTLARMQSPDCTEAQFRSELASLTLGCGAAAMVLSRTELCPDAPRYKGGVTKAATEWNGLCRGNLDRMVTDTRMLLIEGLKLANKTFAAARLALGWVVGELDEFVIHQVSRVHTEALIKAFGIDPAKVLTIFHEHGNIGPASVPIVLSKLRELGRLKKGSRIALLGIGSGLNCSMAEVVW